MRIFILLSITLLFLGCKKDGQPFDADYIIEAKSKITSIRIVEFHEGKERETLYIHRNPNNLSISGFYAYQVTGTLHFEHNTSVIFHITFEENETEYIVRGQIGETASNTTDGTAEVMASFRSDY